MIKLLVIIDVADLKQADTGTLLLIVWILLVMVFVLSMSKNKQRIGALVNESAACMRD
ncbi:MULTISPECIES: hypothetical protein [Colwellia]|uniref:Uncharacterized protein n=1 Tax=Colwellia marinimaniae TaxID=1513592 RepID=A0ABQ0MZE1_9GAMM|nr:MULTISPECIES: hypothetical protein [Colwellia]GAW97679.1 hypothetical protein MTCD1_03319 [Colwellia marinimaniae]